MVPSKSTTAIGPRAIVQEVLPRHMADQIWTASYDKVLPVTSNGFDLSAVLPAMFYMFRFGRRRGAGKFLSTFRPPGEGSASLRERRRATTIDRIAETLAGRSDLKSFDNPVKKAILGDLLLAFCLENSKCEPGRDKQVQRVAPAHYMASWIDLPESSANLRFVPEMVVAMLVNQEEGKYIEYNKEKTRFPIAGDDNAENILLKVFSNGIQRKSGASNSNLKGDKFKESSKNIGIDQLLMIRLAQQLDEPPSYQKPSKKNSGQIPNQRPIAKKSAENFSEDIRRFIRSYADIIPRQVFTNMIEACMSTGMTAILTSVVDILCEWDQVGKVKKKEKQQPVGMFIDCSSGMDHRLQNLAEQSFDDFMRRFEQVPMILMILHLLDYQVGSICKADKEKIQKQPYATEWLDLLGDFLYRHHEKASFVNQTMDVYCTNLADELGEDNLEVTEILENEHSEPNSVRRLATSLTLLGKTRKETIKTLDSTLNMERPNGLARKRKVTKNVHTAGQAKRRQRDARSLVLTDPVLDCLVHLHLLRPGNKSGVRSLSLKNFLKILRERYGFHIDAPPPGMMVPNDLLRQNRMALERRLRDLGLLLGVNDAEAMKQLRPRFNPVMEEV